LPDRRRAERRSANQKGNAMSPTQIALHSAPSVRERRIRNSRPALDLRLIAVVGLFLALLAAELAVVIAAAPAIDPFDLVAVP
jgi:hypothetical protein